ncbi:hypothetical protein PTE30175_00316 [Pandoraea terrae]|uniref:Methylamine utilization protein MauE n=1 Tax=Pandoraea terrae TaxID=1537710 RepID=A0A5E4RSJ3_9BURK|nr:MauE/DoxX family redox-associated membrane protein [Pandoraea terrae]VVD65372.1 hypothetical protein PTE30175_00316 [Pandoraea terrae]
MYYIDPVVRHLGTATGAIVFLISAQSKFRNRAAFAAALDAYRLLPGAMIPVAAAAVLIAEALLAIGLIRDETRAASATGLLVLVGLFAAAIAVNLVRGNRDIDCGCWGFVDRPADSGGGISGWHIVRAAALGVLLAPALFDTTERPVYWVDYLTVLLGVACALTVFFTFDLLLANRPKLSQSRP